MATVLVADDAAFMRHRLRQLLESKGFDVTEAENGRMAVDVYGSCRPDLVILDITMPEMDGLTALREIVTADPSARVVMCSALGQQSMVLEAVRAGARDFIVKPFQPQRVLDAVKRQLDG